MRNRRQFLALLASTALGTALRDAVAGPLDQGIGGTGAVPSTDQSDRGIGGTGVIGTIRKFGSIIVNDLRIAYPTDASVYIDGRPASPSDLKIGQVVRVDASGTTGALSTRTINVTSEVVGPVERVGSGQITVLGQTISTAGLKKTSYTVGDTVAVSGLRRNNGTVVASLIEPRPGAASRVAGPVRLADDGGFRIGGLRLTGIDPTLDGQRALVEGQREGDHLAVSRAVSESSLLPDTRTLSIESYVERRGDRIVLGSGLPVARAGRLDLPAGKSVRAVLTTTLARDGRLTVDSLRANGRTFEGARGQPGAAGGNTGGAGRAPDAAPNGRVPMDFNRGPTSPRGGPGTPEGGFEGRPGGNGPGGGFGSSPGGSGSFGSPFGGGGPGGRR